MSSHGIRDIEVEFDVDSGGSWDVCHVATVSGKNEDGVIYRAKLRFSTGENHFYVKGMGFMGKLVHFEIGATFPFEDLPPIDLACGSLNAKANLMRTTHLILRTVNRQWRGAAERVVPGLITDMVEHVENEKSMAAFAEVIQTTLVSDQEVGDDEDSCVIEA
jgi:hypothetical protein